MLEGAAGHTVMPAAASWPDPARRQVYAVCAKLDCLPGMTSTRCVVAMPQFATEFAEVRLSTCLRIPRGEYLPRAVGAAPKAFAEGRGCGAAGRVRCVRARDVVIRDVLPGPSRRVRAAGEIGEFAGARGRAPQFGFALAATGAKGESDALRPRARAGACGAPGPLLSRRDYGAAAMTASSYLPEPMPVSAKMPWSAIHLKVSS